MVCVAALEGGHVSKKENRPKFDPRRIQWGWKLLGAAFGLWLIGLLLNPISMPMRLWIEVPVRLKLLIGVASLQLIAVILAAIWLFPVVRRRKMRLWSIALMIAVVAITSLYHFNWLTRLNR